ncbi:unnamed protein product [Fraxinus pennsylvanica]|uniref:Uncharacterized protein n=1 Tax=Fraxinus pennsylvanica TaxID=56036 RepID=A0AAD1Z4T9_9LAMI|nr:unnamed protein product [Fraxinus pennsylvanica]
MMDLLPVESPQILIKKKHRFRSLKLVNVNLDDVLPEPPYGVDCGRLDNGLTYYVRCNSKPKMRAILALAVKVGTLAMAFLGIVDVDCYCLEVMNSGATI